MVKRALFAIAIFSSGCFAFTTKDEGREMQKQINELREQSNNNEKRAGELSQLMDEQLKKLKSVIEEATRVVTRNSANLGDTVAKIQSDLGGLQGRLDDLQHSQDALTKQFQDYRAQVDPKMEQLFATLTKPTQPPIPENADGVFAEAEKRLAAAQYEDARRLYNAFLNRYPTDARAAKAQFQIGESYLAEKRYANAIGAYTKVVDNFPKDAIAADAMYKNGLSFYALKYCSDAKVYFQELLKRYPHTSWKSDANEQLKKLSKDLKNKAACAS